MKVHLVKAPPSLLLKIVLLSVIPLTGVIGHVYQFQSIITLVYIPFLFLVSLHLINYNLVLTTPLKYYLLFFILTLFSFITATHLDLFVSESKVALGNMIFGLTLFNLVIYKPKNIKYLLMSYILATYVFAFYLYKNGMLDVSLIRDSKFRVEDEVFNANLFSYYIYLAIFAFFFLFEIYKTKLIIFAYLASLLLYLAVIFLSGSRGGLLIFLLVNALYWMFIGFVRYPKVLKPVFISFILLTLCLPLINLGYSYFMEETNLGYRYNNLFEEGEETSRLVILKVAFDQFLSNPVLGVGSGNFVALNPFRLISHNTFMEILVNNGVFALLLYIAAFVALASQMYLLFNKTTLASEKKVFAIILLFVITFFAYCFLYVFMRVLPYTGFIFMLFAIAFIAKSVLTKEKKNFFEMF